VPPGGALFLQNVGSLLAKECKQKKGNIFKYYGANCIKSCGIQIMGIARKSENK
jgi:hypothetical protein